MVYATGDCHGNILRLEPEYFPEQARMTKEDYVIVCGDLGLIWDGKQEEQRKLDWLEDRPFTTLWVDGNHENFDMLARYPEEEWHGGRAHRIRPSVLHLMRGQVYDICGYTFFSMGGAQSHDIEAGILDPSAVDFAERYLTLKKAKARFRVDHQSWWKEELPGDAEYGEAIRNLERHNWAVDYVITHCAPTSIARSMSRHNEADRLTDFLQMVQEQLDFHYWLFGHYHRNEIIQEKYVLLYEQIVQVL